MKSRIILLVVLLILLAFVLNFRTPRAPYPMHPTPQIPDYQVPEQPTPEPSSSQVRLNQSVLAGGISITPLEVTEDSRCPIGVMCIQAGTVRVKTLLSQGTNAASQVFTLGTPVTTETGIIELTAVEPIKRTDQEIASDAYLFTFEVTPRPELE